MCIAVTFALAFPAVHDIMIANFHSAVCCDSKRGERALSPEWEKCNLRRRLGTPAGRRLLSCRVCHRLFLKDPLQRTHLCCKGVVAKVSPLCLLLLQR